MSAPVPVVGKSDKSEVCAFCAKQVSHRELGEYEVTWRYQGVREKIRGFNICGECKNKEDNHHQERVTHTWMILKARAEKPCCGGGG